MEDFENSPIVQRTKPDHPYSIMKPLGEDGMVLWSSEADRRSQMPASQFFKVMRYIVTLLPTLMALRRQP